MKPRQQLHHRVISAIGEIHKHVRRIVQPDPMKRAERPIAHALSTRHPSKTLSPSKLRHARLGRLGNKAPQELKLHELKRRIPRRVQAARRIEP